MIYTTFREPHRTSRYDGRLQLMKRSVNFSVQGLLPTNGGQADVHEVMYVERGWVLLSAWVNVEIAAPTHSTIDLGYGDMPNQWGRALLIDSTGPIRTALAATIVTYPPDKIFGKGEQYETVVDVPGAGFGDLVSVYNTTNADMGSATVTGYIIGPDRVGINLVNTSEGELSIPTLSLDVMVSKAPMVGHPVTFQSEDTIDITATTDMADVDITSGSIDVCALVLRV